MKATLTGRAAAYALGLALSSLFSGCAMFFGAGYDSHDEPSPLEIEEANQRLEVMKQLHQGLSSIAAGSRRAPATYPTSAPSPSPGNSGGSAGRPKCRPIDVVCEADKPCEYRGLPVC